MARVERHLLFGGPAKHVVQRLETVLGRKFNGPESAATELARKFRSETGEGTTKALLNKTTKLARYIGIANKMERHFTTLGTEDWLQTFDDALDRLCCSCDPDAALCVGGDIDQAPSTPDNCSIGSSMEEDFVSNIVSGDTRTVEHFDIASNCGEHIDEGQTELRDVTEQLLTRVSLLERAYVLFGVPSEPLVQGTNNTLASDPPKEGGAVCGDAAAGFGSDEVLLPRMQDEAAQVPCCSEQHHSRWLACS